MNVDMLIFVKRLNGKVIILGVQASDTIENIKIKIECKEEIPLNEQILLFRGVQLNDKDKLSDCSIVKESKLNLLRIKGEQTYFSSRVNLEIQFNCIKDIICGIYVSF